jgi:hypothetical protein
MRATQVLVPVDAAHEGLDRLHHDRIGRGGMQCGLAANSLSVAETAPKSMS